MSERAAVGSMSVDEYLQFEEHSPTRHEYVAGDVFAMTGGTVRHGRIVRNVGLRLAMATGDGPCEVFIENVRVIVSGDRYYYPDVFVTCKAPADLDLIAREPCVVVEVTSPDTVRNDRNEKLTAYRGIDALRAYIIVDHRRRRVERHWRHSRDEEWQREEIVSAGSVRLPCVDAELTLDEIYRRVELPAVGEPESAYESAKQQANTPQSSV